jgi:hypothetical protein
MDYDIESKLNTVQIKPMTEAEKTTMWQKIEIGMNKKAFHVFGVMRTRVRAIIAFILVVLFAGSSVAFAYADTTQPGDILFPLGVAREKVEIFLAPASRKNDLRVKFAEKRIEDGQVFLSLMVKAKGTYATSFASTTATTTVTTTATTTATTTPNGATAYATADATRHFNATIAYLQGIQAELLKNGDVQASSALQNAIDAMIAQAHQTPTNDSSVLVKIKDNANKFKMDVRIANSTTTTRISLSEKTNNGKKDDHRNDDEDHERIGTTTTIIQETFFSRIFHKEDNKKEKHEDRDDDNDHKDRNKHDDDDDDDDDEHEGFFDRFKKKETICHISGDRKETISVGKSAVKAHLAHGDSLGKCDATGTATTTPDTTAPVVSNIAAATTATTANITWDTNESASYKFWHGTTSPIILSGAPDKTGSTNTHQSAALSGLSADTTYYYVITATDPSGNTSTSTEHSFKTAVIPDTVAPVISDLSATAVTASTATISWNTNEGATGKVKYGTNAPLTNVLENTAITGSHAFNLTGLTASTTYHYVVSSADGAGNATSSSELTFTTL